MSKAKDLKDMCEDAKGKESVVSESVSWEISSGDFEGDDLKVVKKHIKGDTFALLTTEDRDLIKYVSDRKGVAIKQAFKILTRIITSGGKGIYALPGADIGPAMAIAEIGDLDKIIDAA